jgi:hypothetical protein
MFVEFNYANMTFDSTLQDLTSLNSASLRFGTACRYCSMGR